MATRYYFPDFGPISVAPVTPQFTTAWDVIAANADRRAMTTSSAISGNSQNLILSGSGISNTNVLRRQYIGDQIAEQIIAGTIKGQMRWRETNLTDDCCVQMRVFVVDGTGAIIRGILFELINTALTSEFPTSFTNRKMPRGWAGSGSPVTPVFTYNGDRIVIEIGMRQFSNTTATSLPAIQLSTVSGDLPENETTTTALNPWVEFSTNIGPMTAVQRGSEMRSRQAKGKMMALPQVPSRRYMFDNSSIYRKR